MSKARDIASAIPAPSTVSSTELGYLDGVTSAIQTQVDAKIPKTLTTTTGDTIYASSANTPARLGIGTNGQVLTVASGVPSWATVASSAPTLNETVFTASGTFTPATGVTKVWTEIIGGGGGGARGATGGGGGGAGGTINKQFTVTPGTGVTVTIGAGGAAKTSGTGNGNAGTGSTFDTTTADGGGAGQYGGAANLGSVASMGGSAFGAGASNQGTAAANSGAGGGGNTSYGNGGAGGSGRITVRWLS